MFPGEGCFGQVWKCEALNIEGTKGTTTVAVKTLKASATQKERDDLIKELNVMKMFYDDPHPNVVRLMGCCTAGSDKGRQIFLTENCTALYYEYFRTNPLDNGVRYQRKTSRFSEEIPR